MNKIILVDADSLCYIGGSCDEVDQAYDKVDQAISNIISTSSASHYMVFAERHNNNLFRKKIVSSYKIGRVNKELPKFYREIKEYLIGTWNAYGIQGYESDDVIISTWKKLSDEYPFTEILVAGMDKDLKQYPITLFDTYYRRFGEISKISEEDANYNLWLQVIMGDSTDSISGIKGKGIKYAESVLKSSKNHFITTCRSYKEVYGSRWQKNLIKNYVQVRLLDNLSVSIDLTVVDFTD
jgi:5'-3' exonuclease